jgi:TetR/AcrR family acrAB operon transcriptional repressor
LNLLGAVQGPAFFWEGLTYLPSVCILATMGRSSKEKALRTREKILARALDLFASRGFEHVSFSDIGKSLHLSKGAVYWHFKNKEVLLVELVKQALLRLKARLALQQKEINSLAQLEEYYVLLVKVIIEDEFLLKFLKVVYRMAWLPGILASVKQEACQVMLCPEEVSLLILDRLKRENKIRLSLEVADVVHVVECFVGGLLNFYLTHPEDKKNERILDYLKIGLRSIFKGFQQESAYE